MRRNCHRPDTPGTVRHVRCSWGGSAVAEVRRSGEVTLPPAHRRPQPAGLRPLGISPGDQPHRCWFHPHLHALWGRLIHLLHFRSDTLLQLPLPNTSILIESSIRYTAQSNSAFARSLRSLKLQHPFPSSTPVSYHLPSWPHLFGFFRTFALTGTVTRQTPVASLGCSIPPPAPTRSTLPSGSSQSRSCTRKLQEACTRHSCRPFLRVFVGWTGGS